MKEEIKSHQVINVPVSDPQTNSKKESSGDKKFDDAIDRMLKKPVYTVPSK